MDRVRLPLAGAIYFIQVSAKNEVGWGVGLVEEKPFMLIPRVLSPRTSDSQRLQLAVGELSPGVFFVHAWEGSNLVKGSDGHGTISVTVKNI